MRTFFADKFNTIGECGKKFLLELGESITELSHYARNAVLTTLLLIASDGHAEKVSQLLGVTPRTVERRMEASLKEIRSRQNFARNNPGPATILTSKEMREICEFVREFYPSDLDLGTVYWDADIVCHVIYVVFEKVVSNSTVRRILHRDGLSYHKPEIRNLRRDEDAIERWTTITAPELIASDLQSGFTPVFLDECSVRSNEVRRPTWGPRGQRLIVPQGERMNINCIGVIGLDGFSSFLTTKGKIDENFVIAFLEQMLKQNPFKQFAVYRDNASYHRSSRVRAFINENPRLLMRSIPVYAPELNPIELVWACLKNNKLRMLAYTDAPHFEHHVGTALYEIASVISLNKSIFKSKELAYLERGRELSLQAV